MHNQVQFLKLMQLLILELNEISDKTILFSDRPDRIVTSESTVDFIGNWSTREDSFAIDAPNSVLVIDKVREQNYSWLLILVIDSYVFEYTEIPETISGIISVVVRKMESFCSSYI